MKPILYAPGESAFTSQGLGVLSDAISCVVTEVRNGAFELQMTYPIDGIHFDDIAVTSLIMAKPNAYASPQPFPVYRITKPLNGRVSIYAEHISYWMSHIPVKPCTAPTIVAALSALTSAAVGTNPFTLWTDKSTSASFNIKEPRSLRAALGGQQGSILDVYGGEFEFDRYTVKIHNHRGADRGVTIRYGKNLTDLTQEENIANTITGVMPYWINPQDETDIQYATGTVIYSSNADLYPYRRVLSVDFSADFQSKPTGDQLKAKAQSYITSHNIGVPATSWKVSFAALWQTEEYKDAIGIEQVRLCDTVTVQYEKLGVSAQAKVIKTVYDVLLERYTSIEIGDARSDFASTLKKVQEQTAAEADAASATAIERAVNHATQMITGGLGGHVVEVLDTNGKPQELVILGDTDDITTAQDVWRWNHNGLGHSSTGYTGQFTTAITADGHIVADFIDTGNLNASLITTGVLNAALITAGYLSATRIKGGTLTLGGAGDTNGEFEILDANGNAIVTGDHTGLTLNRGVVQSANGTVVIDLNNNTITFPDGSINSNMLSIGDYTNYATVNPNFDGTMCKITGRETETITDTNTSGNPVVFRKKSASQNTCALSTNYMAMSFQTGDELYYEVTARALSGNGGDAAIVVACYDSSKTLLTTKTSAITLTASYQTFTGTLEITNSNFNNAAYVWFYIRDDRTNKSQILVKSAKILKKFGGNVVIDGSLTAGKIHGGTLKLGGTNNGNGLLEVYNSSNVLKGKWTKDGSVYYGTYTDRYSISADQITKIAESGLINASGSKGAFLGGGYLEFGDIGSGWNADTLSPDDVLSTSGRYAILSGDRLLFNYNGYVFLDSPTLELYPSSNTVGILSGLGDLSFRASQGDSDAYVLGFYINTTRKARINKDGMNIYGDMSATGTKSRVVDTKQYSDRLLYCYETASPMFGDVGEGVIGADGKCYVSIDPIFAKTVNLSQYQVFLQKYGQGECYVSERHPSYFIVSGTEGLSFGWEVKAKQSGYDQLRLERNDEPVSISNEINYASEAINHINEIREGRISA